MNVKPAFHLQDLNIIDLQFDKLKYFTLLK